MTSEIKNDSRKDADKSTHKRFFCDFAALRDYAFLSASTHDYNKHIRAALLRRYSIADIK
jgi:hypothetical protein